MATTHPEATQGIEQKRGLGSNAKTVAGWLAALATGMGIGHLAFSGDSDPSKPPTNSRVSTSAPVTPGQPAHSPESTPGDARLDLGPKPYEVTDLSASTFPFVFEGRVYNGAEAFQNACRVKATDYPTPEKAVNRFEVLMNSWISSGSDMPESDHYGAVLVTPDSFYDSVTYTVDLYYNPRFARCLFPAKSRTSPINSAIRGPEVFAQNLKGIALMTNLNWRLAEDDKVPFQAHLALQGTTITPSYGGAYIVDTTLTYGDNGSQNSVGTKRQEPGGYLGIKTANHRYASPMRLAIAVEDGSWQIVGAENSK